MAKPEPYAVTLVDGSWSVTVDQLYQPCDPDLPGAAPMDRGRAEEVARQLAGRLEYDLAEIGDPEAIIPQDEGA